MRFVCYLECEFEEAMCERFQKDILLPTPPDTDNQHLRCGKEKGAVGRGGREGCQELVLKRSSYLLQSEEGERGYQASHGD